MRKHLEALIFAMTIFVLIALAIAITLIPAQATVPSKPYTFTAGTTIQSAQVNADFDTLYSLLNGGLDASNFSLARGIGPNYINTSCGGCTGTFGPGSYIFTPQSVNGVPVTFLLINGQSADAFQVKSGSGAVLSGITGAGDFYDFAFAANSALCTTSGRVITTSCSFGYVTAVNASGNLSSSGGTQPTITLSANPSVTTVTASSYASASEFEAGTHGGAGVPILEPSAGHVAVGCEGSAQNCPIYWYSAGTGNAQTATLDNGGVLTATNFLTGSRREWKRHIRPLGFDAIRVLEDLDLAQYDCADPRCGPRGYHKIGYIANNAPVMLSGPKHDHFDAGALATVDAAAIRQLESQVQDLRHEVARLQRARR